MSRARGQEKQPPPGWSAPLVPPRLRLPAGVVSLLSLVLTVALALVVRGDRAPLAVDLRGAALLDQLPQPSSGFRWAVVLLGNPMLTLVIAAVIGLSGVAAGRPRGAALVAVATVVALGSAWFLQPGIGRTLRGVDAYPSGHTVTTSTIALVLAVLVLGARHPSRRWRRLVLASVIVLVPVIVAVFLVTLDLHYLTDTIGGASLSLAVVLGGALFIDALVDRRREAPEQGGRTRGGSR